MKRFKILSSLIVLPTSLLIAQDNLESRMKYNFNPNYPYWLDTLPCKPYDRDSILSKAMKYLGTPYLENGKDPNGFDCSGFMFYLHVPYCIYLPYFSSQMAGLGKSIEISKAQKGDLIIFKGYDLKAELPGHVGMVVSNDGGKIKFIHASTSKGVRIDVLKGNTYFEPRFLDIKRIVEYQGK